VTSDRDRTSVCRWPHERQHWELIAACRWPSSAPLHRLRYILKWLPNTTKLMKPVEASCTRLGDMLLETQVGRDSDSGHPYTIAGSLSIGLWAKLQGRGMATQKRNVVLKLRPLNHWRGLASGRSEILRTLQKIWSEIPQRSKWKGLFITSTDHTIFHKTQWHTDISLHVQLHALFHYLSRVTDKWP